MTAEAASAPGPLRDEVRAEQVRLLYANGGAPMVVTLGVAATTAWVLIRAGTLSPLVAAIWLAVMAAQASVRLVLRAVFLRATPPSADWKPWADRFMVGSAAGAVTWGLGCLWLLPPGHLDLQLLVVVVLIAVIYGTITAFGSYLPAFYALFLPAFLPIVGWFLAQGDSTHIGIAVLFIAWLPTVGMLARRYNRNLVEALELRFENAALAEDLRGQKLVAEQASLAKSRFLAAASHDLRQPVHALGMFIGALRSHRLPARTVALIDHIDASVGAMDGLFTSLLDISKLDAGVVEARLEAVPLQPLIARIVRDLAGEAEGKAMALVHVRTGLVVESDPILLERILRNLIGNAVRYTETGRVVVGARRLGRHKVRLEVWDTGPGIAEAEREAIFEEFYQLSNPDRDRARGLGLGLAIVRRLTAILGHELGFESRVGKGSVFRVTLERVAVREAAPAPREAAAADAQPALVLVIDDEAAIRAGMSELLASWGHRALTAAGSDEAFALLDAEGGPPDLIVSDYRLRGEDGIAAIRRLQAEFGAHIPAILLTGDTAADRIREAQASGYPLLHKPVPHARLRAAVANLLRKGGRAKVSA